MYFKCSFSYLKILLWYFPLILCSVSNFDTRDADWWKISRRSHLEKPFSKHRFLCHRRGIFLLLKAKRGILNAKIRFIFQVQCIEQHGHDFRPDFLELSSIRGTRGKPTTLGNVKFLCLSGSLSAEGLLSARSALHLQSPVILVESQDRSNIELLFLEAKNMIVRFSSPVKYFQRWHRSVGITP